MSLTRVTKAKNTAEIARVVVEVASVKDTVNNVTGLSTGVKAINTAEIARATAALTSNYDTSN